MYFILFSIGLMFLVAVPLSMIQGNPGPIIGALLFSSVLLFIKYILWKYLTKARWWKLRKEVEWGIEEMDKSNATIDITKIDFY